MTDPSLDFPSCLRALAAQVVTHVPQVVLHLGQVITGQLPDARFELSAIKSARSSIRS